jgi:sugar lactone lactonase YvrE
MSATSDLTAPPPPRRARRVLRVVALTTTGIAASAALVIGGLITLVAPPVPDFDPVAWSPGPGATPQVQPTTATADPASRWLFGPEDVAVGPDGAVYTGDRDGVIHRIGPDGTDSVHAEVGGRPLGLVLDAGGSLLIANHGIGLQQVTPDGAVRTLVSEVDGRPVAFANDLAIGPDGVVWFSDSSTRYHRGTLGDHSPSYLFPDLLDGHPTGRLLAYDPRTGQARQVLDGLYLPNGIAVGADGTQIWIAESNRYRILRHDLISGVTDVLLDDLPGVPDGLTTAPDGSVLLALYDRTAALDDIALPTPLGREILARLPMSWFVNETDPLGGSILVLAPDGTPRHHVTGLTPAPTNVVPHGDRWWLGALLGQPLRIMAVPG